MLFSLLFLEQVFGKNNFYMVGYILMLNTENGCISLLCLMYFLLFSFIWLCILHVLIIYYFSTYLFLYVLQYVSLVQHGKC